MDDLPLEFSALIDAIPGPSPAMRERLAARLQTVIEAERAGSRRRRLSTPGARRLIVVAVAAVILAALFLPLPHTSLFRRLLGSANSSTATIVPTTVSTVPSSLTSLPPQQVLLPRVRGDSLSRASQLLQSSGFVVAVIYKPTGGRGPVADGTVLAESPPPDKTYLTGTTVTLTVAGGKLMKVPASGIVGQPLVSARRALSAAGFLVPSRLLYEFSSTVAVNDVITTDPRPGMQWPAAEPVSLVISEGSGVVVPNVALLTERAAIAKLQAAHLTYNVELDITTGYADGEVISQAPKAGTLAMPGFSVTIFVDSGHFTGTTNTTIPSTTTG